MPGEPSVTVYGTGPEGFAQMNPQAAPGTSLKDAFFA